MKTKDELHHWGFTRQKKIDSNCTLECSYIFTDVLPQKKNSHHVNIL